MGPYYHPPPWRASARFLSFGFRFVQAAANTLDLKRFLYLSFFSSCSTYAAFRVASSATCS